MRPIHIPRKPSLNLGHTWFALKTIKNGFLKKGYFEIARIFFPVNPGKLVTGVNLVQHTRKTRNCLVALRTMKPSCAPGASSAADPSGSEQIRADRCAHAGFTMILGKKLSGTVVYFSPTREYLLIK